MRNFLTLLICAAICTCVSAQRQTFTKDQFQATDISTMNGDRRIKPARAVSFRVDGEALRDFLFTAPHERKLPAEESPFVLTLPMPEGQTADFRIVGYDISAQGGLDKFPNIRTFYGVNVENGSQTIFLDWTARGFHASIRGGGSQTVYIDPLFRGNVNDYQIYRRTDYGPEQAKGFSCFTGGGETSGILPADVDVERKLVGGCELREYRFTMTTTGEYSNYHNAFSVADVDTVQSAVVTVVNRMNQIYTHDISVRFQLVANNDLLYNYDPDTDIFNGNSTRDMFDKNTDYTNDIIGPENYDFGHSLTQGGNNGIGRFEAPCVIDLKAMGASSHETPEADFFHVSIVAHELGHNFDGRHTQNVQICNYDSQGGVEPGSGNTIMGYAGICDPNIQDYADDYFHGHSLFRMTSYAELREGADCGTIINTSLTTPTAATSTDETIPAGTPFALKTNATGDGELTYNWEQINGERGAEMPPVSTNVNGPLFKSNAPTASDEHYFPNLGSTMAGIDPEWESLPTVARTMDFRATIRNSNAAYGCATENDIRLTVNDSGDPFTVTDPGEGSIISEGQIAQVQWDVAGTDALPINSQLVDILLSTDGGGSLQTLLTDAPNNGSAEVVIPMGTAATASVMVKSKDNVFFNVSDGFFTIASAEGPATIAVIPTSGDFYSDCYLVNTSARFDLQTTSTGGAESPITWTVNGVPPGVTPEFSINPVRPGGNFTLFLRDADNLPFGTTPLILSGTSSDGTLVQNLTVERFAADGAVGPAIIGPIGGQTTIRPVLSAESESGTTFEIQVSRNADFSTLDFSLASLTEPTFTPDTYLAPETDYFWRIREGSECGTSQWSNASFRTGDCEQIPSVDRQILITSTSGPFTAEKAVFLDESQDGVITDIDVFELDVTHGTVSNLTIDLQGPDGTQAVLFDGSCGTRNNLFLSYDDEASTATLQCNRAGRVSGIFYRPSNNLSIFDGQDAGGSWLMTVTDNARVGNGVNSGNSGNFRRFTLVVCREGLLPVTFTDFNALSRDKDIKLTWETVDEFNNEGFYIERQVADISAASHWDELGFVAAGTAYEFIDATAEANTDYLYRLRQTDFDGRVSYSPIETARFGSEAGSGLVLFPNPTSGEIQYRLPGSDQPQPYALFSVTGQLLEQGILSTSGGQLNLTARNGGVYLLRVGDRTYRIVRW